MAIRTTERHQSPVTCRIRVLINIMISESNQKTVIVVGAGFAGISAARWLLDNDHLNHLRVIVLEARNRIGGRVYTAKDLAGSQNSQSLGPFDLGASWLHDPSSNNPISILAHNMQLPLQETNWDDDLVVNLSGTKYIDEDLVEGWNKFKNTVDSTINIIHQNPTGCKYNSLEMAVYERCPEWFTDPILQMYASHMDFEFGAPLYACSASECIDRDWMASQDVDSEDEEEDLCDQTFPITGYVAILENLVRTGLYTRDMWKRYTKSEWTHTLEGDDEVVPPAVVAAEIKVISATVNDFLAVEPMPEREQIDIRLNHIVKSIIQDSDGQITLTASTTTSESGTASGIDTIGTAVTTFNADAVICTLPLGVLKSGDVAFEPPLSAAKQNAIEQVGYGNVVKIVLEFSRLFWPTDAILLSIADVRLTVCSVVENAADGGCSCFSSQKRGLLTQFLNSYKVCGKNILIGYAVGDGADIVDKMSDDEVLTLALSRLACFTLPGHDKPCTSDVVHMVRTHWRSDPFSKGAYSYSAAGNPYGLRNELRRREGNIWFAGEATNESSQLTSSTTGAFESGVLAARDVFVKILN